MRIKNAVSIILAVVLCTALTAPLTDSAQPTAELTESPEGWSEDVRLTNHTNANRKTNMATEGDEIHIVWERFMGEDNGYYEVFYMKSEDDGRTWSEPLRMSEHEYSVWNPDIAVHGDHVHVVWDRLAPSVSRQTYYRRSTDGGETWHPERLISRDDGYDSVGPTIAVGDDGISVHVVWVDERHEDESWPLNTELYYNRSLDGGETWEGELRMTDAPYYSASQQIAVEGETVHVLWSDARYGVTSGDLFYKVSYDNGETWSDDFILADTPDSEISGAIAVDENNIHVIWVRMVGSTYYLYYRNSTDNGETWSPAQLLWGPYDLVSNPDISVLGDEVNVVWAGRIEEGEDTQIYFKESLDGGISWEDDLRLTYTVNNSWDPSIAMVDSMKHVVWNDLRHGNRELYYKRNPDFISESGPPEIYDVNVTDVTKYSAVVEWKTDRECDGTVRYSENPDFSDNETVSESYLKQEHSFPLEDLTFNTTYYFEVSSTDENGNTTVDDNDGEYYSFTTAAVPPPEITDVSVIDITEFSAVVEWSTDRPTDSTVRYSENADLSGYQSVYSSSLVTDHSLLLEGLEHNTTYYFEVSSLDEEGYSSTDDNDGEYYSFTTAALPPPEINDLTDDEAYTGEEFTFEAEVSSLLDISDVQVEYRIDPGTINSVSLAETEGIWQHVTSLPEDTVEIEYHITAWDSDGTGNSTETRTVDVVDIIPPEADAGSDMDIKKGELVTFNGTGSEDNIGVVRYHWQMEIGGSDVELLGVTPTFEFTDPGEYVVTLTVEDAEGNTDSDSITVTVHQSEEKDPPDETRENVSSLWWILIMPIALVITISLRYHRRKKS